MRILSGLILLAALQPLQASAVQQVFTKLRGSEDTHLEFYVAPKRDWRTDEIQNWSVDYKNGEWEFESGSGFVSQTNTVHGPIYVSSDEERARYHIDSLDSHSRATYTRESIWGRVRYQPFYRVERLNGIALSLRLDHADSREVSKTCARYISSPEPGEPTAWRSETFDCTFRGPKFLSYTVGAEFELLELILRRRAHHQVHFGAGGTNLENSASILQPRPFTSLRYVYRLADKLSCSAGVVASAQTNDARWDWAVDGFKFDYQF